MFLSILVIVGGAYLTLLILGVSSWKELQSLTSQTRADVLKSFVEAMAIIVAGLWTYELYIRNRYDHPYPKIKHRIEHYELGNDIVYLSMFVTLINEGKTKLDLKDGKVYIRQVLPMPERLKDLFKKSVSEGKSIEIRNGEIPDLFIDSGQRIGWDTLGSRNWGPSKEPQSLWLGLRDQNPIIEPGQTKEFQFDFFIEKKISVIVAISYINQAKGWGLATLYSVGEGKTG